MQDAHSAAFRGSRAYTPHIAAANAAAERFNGVPGGINKLELARLTKRNRGWAGLSPAQMDQLEFLILQTRDQDWDPGQRPVVWWSVDATADKMGISTRQVERREDSLCAAGMITWKDSGNHKRWGRRDEYGYIIEAYGADLSPLGAMVPELLKEDRRRNDELRARKELARERQKALAARRTVKAMLDRASQDGLLNPETQEWRDKVEILGRDIPAGTPPAALREVSARLQLLADELKTLLQPPLSPATGWKRKVPETSEKRVPKHGKNVEMSPWDDVNVGHIETTDLKSYKLITSTPACGQSTACGGKADAPCGAKSTFETINGRKKGRGEKAGAIVGRENTPDGGYEGSRADGEVAHSPCGKGRRRSGPSQASAAGRPERKGSGAAVDATGERERSKHGNGICGQSREPGTVRGERPETGGSWEPDRGIQHINLLNFVEAAGPRFWDSMLRTERPDWLGFEDTAKRLCPKLGIGQQEWWVAVTVMGRRAASISVMLIDRKMSPGAKDPVRCPGAYLRGMTDRARDNKLHLHASVFGWARKAAA